MTISVRWLLSGVILGAAGMWFWIIYQRQQTPPRTSRIIDIYAQTRKIS